MPGHPRSYTPWGGLGEGGGKQHEIVQDWSWKIPKKKTTKLQKREVFHSTEHLPSFTCAAPHFQSLIPPHCCIPPQYDCNSRFFFVKLISQNFIFTKFFVKMISRKNSRFNMQKVTKRCTFTHLELIDAAVNKQILKSILVGEHFVERKSPIF